MDAQEASSDKEMEEIAEAPKTGEEGSMEKEAGTTKSDINKEGKK